MERKFSKTSTNTERLYKTLQVKFKGNFHKYRTFEWNVTNEIQGKLPQIPNVWIKTLQVKFKGNVFIKRYKWNPSETSTNAERLDTSEIQGRNLNIQLYARCAFHNHRTPQYNVSSEIQGKLPQTVNVFWHVKFSQKVDDATRWDGSQTNRPRSDHRSFSQIPSPVYLQISSDEAAATFDR